MKILFSPILSLFVLTGIMLRKIWQEMLGPPKDRREEITSAEDTLHLEIPLLLPEVEDEKDACIERLLERMKNRQEIKNVHIEHRNGAAFFCLHFDPSYLTIEKVRRVSEQEGAAISDRYRHESMHITDMDCGDCATSIEHILGRKEGILNISVNYAAEKMWVEYDSKVIKHDRIVDQVQSLGYTVEEKKEEKGWIRENWEMVLSLLAGFFLAVGFFGEMLLEFSSWAALGFYIIAYITGGWDAAKHGVKAALHLSFDIDFLMVVAALGAAALAEWPEGAFLLFLFSLGHALEHYATDRARHAIKALGEITPKTARVQRDGDEIILPVEHLERGDVVILRSGERIPIDGKVIDGESSVDESPITGESIPVEKNTGEEVLAGSVNGDGALEIQVTRLAKDSTLARVIQMVEEAQAQKSPTQRFTQKFQRVFVPVTLGIVLLMIVLPPLFGWLTWDAAFLRAMAILVAASPCALAIATPSAVLSAIGHSARNGVLIKGGGHLENLGAVQAIALDKTGTITEGKLRVTDIHPEKGVSEAELLSIAAAVESRSIHPLAQAIVQKAQEKQIEFNGAADVQSFSGKGVTARVRGNSVSIGNRKLFEGILPASLAEKGKSLEEAGKTTMFVKSGETFLGILALADQPRSTAKKTFEQLKNLGIRSLVMITGDNERVANAVAEQVGLTEFQASLLPEQKVEAVKKLVQQYQKVAMVGDGVNDAPAMTSATVGIAMGAGGTDVALETADVALMADDLSKLPFVVALSRQSRRVIKQNLWISLGVIAALIPASMFGFANIGIAIIFHEGSTLVVVANALRLLRFTSHHS